MASTTRSCGCQTSARASGARSITLGTPPGKAISTASAINNKGTIAGSSLNAEFSAGRAFVWRPSRPHGTAGTMTNLPQPRGVTGSGAAAINDHGLIVGTLITAGGQTHAFVFRTRMHDLGTLPGGTESFAHGISNHGVIVGYSTTANGTFRAVMWAYGKIINLNRSCPAGRRRPVSCWASPTQSTTKARSRESPPSTGTGTASSLLLRSSRGPEPATYAHHHHFRPLMRGPRGARNAHLQTREAALPATA